MTTFVPLTMRQRLTVLETMGCLPVARHGQEWTAEHAAAVARLMRNTQWAAELLREFHFPLSVALAVLVNRHVDVLL